MEYLIELGYIGLFVGALLAATLLPMGSEVMVVGLLLNEFPVVQVVLVATVGNVLGSVINYGLGYWGSEFAQAKLKVSDATVEQARQRYEKWGAASLLLAWVPIIGDPLTVIAGALRINIWLFIGLVTLGKLGRYSVVAYLTLM
ncbi:MAG: DedA family protein [Gammaproteobacteria bacterium]|nr:DedA family protein [Gammaproteobacteria bacterium]